MATMPSDLAKLPPALAHGCARQLQERIAPDGAIAAVAELGWAD